MPNPNSKASGEAEQLPCRLRSIFLLWYPQTHAPLSARLRALDQIRKLEPDVAWKLMLGILPGGQDTASPASHTRWRDLSTDEQEEITYPLIAKGGEEVAQRLLSDVGVRADRWPDLIAAFPNLLPEHRTTALDQLASAAAVINDDDARATISGAMRRLLSRHRELAEAEWAIPEVELAAALALYPVFQPHDLIRRSAWLFASHVELPNPAIKIVGGKHVDDAWKVDEQEAANQRRVVIREIVEVLGVEGVFSLARAAEFTELVGRALAELTEYERERETIFVRALTGPEREHEAIAHGMTVASMTRHGDAWVKNLLARAANECWGDEATFRILRALPETKTTWERAKAAGKTVDDLYWKRRSVVWIDASDGDLIYAVEKLLEAGRGKRAIDLLGHCRRESVAVALLIRVLLQAAREPWTDSDRNAATMFRYYVVEMFKMLDKTQEVPDEQMGALEWAYLPLFQFSDRPPRMLQKALSTDPAFFIEVLRKVYRPSKESNIEEASPEDPDREQAIARQAYDLLHTWRRLPGTSDDGTLNPAALESWVKEARSQAAQIGRGAIGDHQIGQVLAYAPRNAEGIWPVEPVRDLIEITRSPELERGILIDIRNSRGATWRGMTDGGAQERDLAQYYRRCSEEAPLEWPRTSALLEQIAKSYEHEGVAHDDDAERRDW